MDWHIRHEVGKGVVREARGLCVLRVGKGVIKARKQSTSGDIPVHSSQAGDVRAIGRQGALVSSTMKKCSASPMILSKLWSESRRLSLLEEEEVEQC